MLVKSLVAVLMSIPATVAILGVLMAVTPASPSITMPLLLAIFPVWVCLACASYLLPRAADSAAVLSAIAGAGFCILAFLKFAGWATL